MLFNSSTYPDDAPVVLLQEYDETRKSGIIRGLEATDCDDYPRNVTFDQTLKFHNGAIITLYDWSVDKM